MSMKDMLTRYVEGRYAYSCADEGYNDPTC